MSARILLGLLTEEGFSIEEIVRVSGVPPMQPDDPAPIITGAQEFAIQQGFAEATAERPDLWVEAGRRYRMFSYDPLGLAQITAATLREALALVERFGDLHYSPARFEFSRGRDLVGVTLHYEAMSGVLVDFLSCRDAIALTNFFHDLWGGHFPFEQIEVSSAVPLQAGFDFRAPVREAATSGWWWRTELMEARPPQADPISHAVYVARCEAMTAGAEDAGPKGRLLRLFEQRQAETWTVDRAARAMNMSRRSLQRALEADGLTFSGLLDDSRRGMACRLVGKGEEPIGRIAWRLGYADSASFHQAFRRWTGESPSRYRRDAQRR